MDTLRDEIRAFIAACESLLALPAMLNERETSDDSILSLRPWGEISGPVKLTHGLTAGYREKLGQGLFHPARAWIAMPIGIAGHHQGSMPDIALHFPGRQAFV